MKEPEIGDKVLYYPKRGFPLRNPKDPTKALSATVRYINTDKSLDLRVNLGKWNSVQIHVPFSDTPKAGCWGWGEGKEK